VLPLVAAVNPKVVEAPAPRAPFQPTFFTVTDPELPVAVPFQMLAMLCPLARVISTVQLVMALVPAVTVT
jgi:hypothetical protein